jgi:transcriptional regulator with XRE-family HTH domain
MALANLLDVAVDLAEMGRRIDQARKTAGYSISKLSYATEIDAGLLRRYIRGATEPGAPRLAKIAAALNVNSDWLLQNTENPSPIPVRWDGTTERRSNPQPPASGGAPTGELPVPRKRTGRRRSA